MKYILIERFLAFIVWLLQGTINVQDEMYTNWDNMDFRVTEKVYLVLSEKAINTLKCFQLDSADITDILQQ